mgnify:FL=1
MQLILWMLFAYLAGSISFAIVLAKVCGMDDPRTYGSNNPGATNMLRSGRKGVALLTLLGDAFKGFLPVYLASRYGELSLLSLSLVALAAFVGHLYPVFFKFVGGKGVATFLGVVLGLSAQIGWMTALVWLLVAVLTRYSSLSSMLCSVFALFGLMYLWGVGFWMLAFVAMVGLLFYRHRANITKLLAGQESKLFAKKIASD